MAETKIHKRKTDLEKADIKLKRDMSEFMGIWKWVGILIILTLIFSGGTEIVEIEVPKIVQTVSTMTLLSDVTGSVDIKCYNDSAGDDSEPYRYFYDIPILNDDLSPDLSKVRTEAIDTLPKGSLTQIDTFMYPVIEEPYVDTYVAVYDYDSCALTKIHIRYNLVRYIDNIKVIDIDTSSYGHISPSSGDFCNDDDSYEIHRCLNDQLSEYVDLTSVQGWKDIIYEM
ncbi:hypothetical protein GQ472_01900 [archaeon]|nr:hypothetical protein [archaeon]